jgi:hypothetical protein
MKTLSVDDQTHKRLTSIMGDMMQEKKRNVNYDDVINELIDVGESQFVNFFGSVPIF